MDGPNSMFHVSKSDLLVGCVVTFMGKISKGENNETDIETLGWLLCDGRALRVEMYPELFLILGYMYGGSEHEFYLPDLRGHVLGGNSGVDANKKTLNNTNNETNDRVGFTETFSVHYIMKYR